MDDSAEPAFLTTREVAALLHVKERKVYDLAATDEIPHRRITGKLLFPRAEIAAWMDGAPAGVRPAVLGGSHDPLLDWALRESGAGLAVMWNGSRAGLEDWQQGRAALAGMHLPDTQGWNIETVAARGLRDAVLIGWAARARGLLLRPGLEAVQALSDLAGHSIVRRQEGAGTAALLDRLLADAPGVTLTATVAHTESDAAAMVAEGSADAALGLASMAARFRLAFVPLMQERYDLLIDRRAYFTEPVQRLLAFARTPALAERAARMGGYDLSDMGAVRWLSP